MSKRFKNQNTKTRSKDYMSKQSYRKGKPRCDQRSDAKSDKPKSKDEAMLEAEGRNNDPNWYFLDKAIAEQISQCSFRTIAGYPLRLTVPKGTSGGTGLATTDVSLNLNSVTNILLNPSAGVQVTYDPLDIQKSGINLAGFRLFQKISAFTGRDIKNYGPQDLSILILYMGEIISMMEWARRVFGVFYTSSERNRAYPRAVLQAMRVDPVDFANNYAQYRTRFNALVTRLNATVIPKNVNYFDKCASLYEKIYLDSESPMATTLFFSPATVWRLDETSYEGGTILKSFGFTERTDGTAGTQPLSFGTYWLPIFEQSVDILMNSATFNYIYMDLLNLAAHQSMEFWKFDYLLDGYTVMPEYNRNFMLQLHNMTIMGLPTAAAFTTTGAGAVTPFNDVYPDVEKNALFYNPGWEIYSNLPTTAPTNDVIIDSDMAAPGTEDRIEMMRFTSLSGTTIALNVQGTNYTIDAVLPDHYVVQLLIRTAEGTVSKHSQSYNNADWNRAVLYSQIDWAPLQYVLEKNSDGTYSYSKNVVGDLNYFTTVDKSYLRQVDDFVGFALYDVR